MFVDAHTHVFFPEVVRDRDLFFDDSSFAMLYSGKKSKLADADTLYSYMDVSKTDLAFVFGFGWEKAERCLLHNEYLLDMEERIFPFASLPPFPGKASNRVFHQITDNNFSGIGELSFYTRRMDDTLFSYIRDIFALARQEHLPVSMHVNEPVGHTYPGKYSTPFDKLFELLCDFQDVPVILAHWGGGIFVYEMMPEVRKNLKHVYYDTAASPYLYDESIYTNAFHILDDEKILFGTDFPLLSSSRYIAEIDRSGIEEKLKNKLLGLNARKFLQCCGNLNSRNI